MPERRVMQIVAVQAFPLAGVNDLRPEHIPDRAGHRRPVEFDPGSPPEYVAVNTGADEADAVGVGVGVGPDVGVAVTVAVAASAVGTVTVGKFDQGPRGWPLASTARTAYWYVAPGVNSRCRYVVAVRLPSSSCCQPRSATSCVKSTYLTAPDTAVQLSSISFAPTYRAVSKGADEGDAVGVAVGVDPCRRRRCGRCRGRVGCGYGHGRVVRPRAQFPAVGVNAAHCVAVGRAGREIYVPV